MRWIAGGMLLLSTAASAGEIQGRVRSPGPALVGGTLEVLRDKKQCGESQPDESVLLGPGDALQNAVAYLVEPPKGQPAPPPGNVVLDQRHCRYIPHVLAGRVGGKLEVVNSDPILHNVNATQGTRTAFNVAFPVVGQKRTFPLTQAGVLRAGCNAGHTWMTAWIHVFDHPFFAVTGPDGTFALPGVPPGRYTLAVWHEKLGVQKVELTVPAQGAATVTVEFPRS